MVNNFSRLICYFDGQPGGTGYTVDYARKMRLEIVNRHPPLDATARVLKKKTFDRVQNAGRLTQHGLLNILERWSQSEPWAVQRLLARK